MAYTAEQIEHEVLTLQDRLCLPDYSLVLVGGAALTVAGLKPEASDIDASVNRDVLRLIRRELPTERKEGVCGSPIETFGSWEVANGWGSWPHRFIRDESIGWRRVSILRAAHVVEWKNRFGRPKDKIDVNWLFDQAIGMRDDSRAFRRFIVLGGFERQVTYPQQPTEPKRQDVTPSD